MFNGQSRKKSSCKTVSFDLARIGYLPHESSLVSLMWKLYLSNRRPCANSPVRGEPAVSSGMLWRETNQIWQEICAKVNDISVKKRRTDLVLQMRRTAKQSVSLNGLCWTRQRYRMGFLVEASSFPLRPRKIAKAQI